MEVGYASSSTPTDSSSGGLRFGKKIYFGDVGSGSILAGAESGRTPRPPKRGRGGLAHGTQPPRCQVEGCQADLSEAKSYYSKHKVCGTHSKSPMVIVAGLEQRFCQQCSRFHQLAEFDQTKRSCRRRLAGHNERRRKPPFGSLFSQHYGNLSWLFGNNGQRESFLMDFTQYSHPPSSRACDQTWDGETIASEQFLQSMWHSREGFSGASDSTPALSLLSNQPSGLGLNSLFYSNGVHDEVHPPSDNADNINGFSSPWGFKGDQANFSSSLFTLMLPQSTHDSSGNILTDSDQLEMDQDTGRSFMGLEYSGYDSSVQDVHWTL